jgi:hypothetical protein
MASLCLFFKKHHTVFHSNCTILYFNISAQCSDFSSNSYFQTNSNLIWFLSLHLPSSLRAPTESFWIHNAIWCEPQRTTGVSSDGDGVESPLLPCHGSWPCTNLEKQPLLDELSTVVRFPVNQFKSVSNHNKLPS